MSFTLGTQSGLRKLLSNVQTTVQGNSTFYNVDQQNQGTLKQGWLKKQGGLVKSWHMRWFVLKEDDMFYFSTEDISRQPLGVIHLSGNRVVELPFSTTDSDKFLFEVIPGADRNRMTSNHDTYLLCATNDDERKAWVQILRRVMFSKKGGGIFGQNLDQTMSYEHLTSNRRVPAIVEMCTEYILINGVDTEGIFRMAGRTAMVREVKEQFDSGERPNFLLPESMVDLHTVASLLKQYLRDLPEPLIPNMYYEEVMKLVTRDMHTSPDRALPRLAQVIAKLPPCSYNLLQYLSKFLFEISTHSDKNKMPAMNLATVFVHSVIRPEDEDPALLMGTANGRTQVVYLLIIHCHNLFRQEYTSKGELVRTDMLLDLDIGEENHTIFNPDSSCCLESSSRVSQLYDFNSDKAPVLPEPMSPAAVSETRGSSESNSNMLCRSVSAPNGHVRPKRPSQKRPEPIYQDPFDALPSNLNKHLPIDQRKNGENDDPTYTEVYDAKKPTIPDSHMSVMCESETADFKHADNTQNTRLPLSHSLSDNNMVQSPSNISPVIPPRPKVRVKSTISEPSIDAETMLTDTPGESYSVSRRNNNIYSKSYQTLPPNHRSFEPEDTKNSQLNNLSTERGSSEPLNSLKNNNVADMTITDDVINRVTSVKMSNLNPDELACHAKALTDLVHATYKQYQGELLSLKEQLAEEKQTRTEAVTKVVMLQSELTAFHMSADK